MKTLGMMRKKSINELSRKDRICLYLKDHPECLTDELMDEVATKLLNYGYLRKKIILMYKKILIENLKKDNFILTPEHYE